VSSGGAFVDGITVDYPALAGDRLESLPLGMLQCCRVAHLVQEAVDPETGEPQALSFFGGWRQWRAVEGGANAMCPLCMFMEQRGEPVQCEVHKPPKSPGVCLACWSERNDPNYFDCPLHMTNRKIAGVIGCPICALDPLEAKRCREHVAKMEEVAREMPRPEEFGDEALAEQAPPATVIIVAGTGNAEIRAAALARRAAERAAKLREGSNRG
jgi:hypothetical protein